MTGAAMVRCSLHAGRDVSMNDESPGENNPGSEMRARATNHKQVIDAASKSGIIPSPTMAKSSAGPSAASLRRAADIQERIDTLQHELSAILGGQAVAAAPAAAAEADDSVKAGPGRRRRRRMSAEARARIGAAAKARWARYRAQKG